MFNKLKNNPKVWMISSLIPVALFALPRQDLLTGIRWLLLSVSVAIALDILAKLIKKEEFIFPSSAAITGLIVGMVLDYHQRLWVLAGTVTLAILSKHILIWKKRHVFNPANFGLLVSSLFFQGVISWWGAGQVLLIIISGFFIAFKMRRLSLVAIFLGLHLFFLGLHSLFLQRGFVNQLTLLNFYFAFFMLVEPRTSPKNVRGRLIYGILTALFVFIFFGNIPQYDSHILALACANLLVPLINGLVF
jgi:Na+-translocating ferredoxin:NAD+ oxidoreductase RnfD subunit